MAAPKGVVTSFSKIYIVPLEWDPSNIHLGSGTWWAHVILLLRKTFLDATRSSLERCALPWAAGWAVSNVPSLGRSMVGRQGPEPANYRTEPLKYRTRGPEAGPALEGGLRQPSSLARTIYLCMSALSLRSIYSASLRWGAPRSTLRK